MGAGILDHCLKCFSYDFKNGICLKCGRKSGSAKGQKTLLVSIKEDGENGRIYKSR